MSSKNIDSYNTDAAWTKLYKRLENDGLIHKNKANRYRIVKIAAFWLIGLGIAYWTFYNYTDRNKKLIVVDNHSNTIKTVILPDSSIVYLNINAQLRYPDNFVGKQRKLKLKGEAFFDIKKNPNKYFIISTLGKEIKVLGTSFSVKTDSKNKQVKVFVETGKVQFYELNNMKKQLILEAGFVGIINENTVKKQKIEDPNYLAWKTKYFDFSYGERIDVIINKLNEAYHTNIVLANKNLKHKIMYTTYNKHSLDTILQLIAIVNNLKIEKKKDKIVLK